MIEEQDLNNKNFNDPKGWSDFEKELYKEGYYRGYSGYPEYPKYGDQGYRPMDKEEETYYKNNNSLY